MHGYHPSDLIADQFSVVSHPSRHGENRPARSHGEASSMKGKDGPSFDQLVGLAAALSSARGQRREFLDPGLFGEPGWDMLLALFCAEGKGQRLTVSDVCVASESPQTTALRWLDRLKQLDFVERHASRADARVVYVILTPAAHQAIENYLLNIWGLMFRPR